jgi:type I restriction enzyme M protein
LVTTIVVLIDAANLGETIKEGKNQKTVLTTDEENQIINAFNNKDAIDEFSVVVSYDDIKAKNLSLSAGQYFDVKLKYADISQEEFKVKLSEFDKNLAELFSESKLLEDKIQLDIQGLKYEI